MPAKRLRKKSAKGASVSLAATSAQHTLRSVWPPQHMVHRLTWRRYDKKRVFSAWALGHLATKVVMLAQPRSSECLLQTVVADQQRNLLQDYQAGAMMTNYNSRERAR